MMHGSRIAVWCVRRRYDSTVRACEKCKVGSLPDLRVRENKGLAARIRNEWQHYDELKSVTDALVQACRLPRNESRTIEHA
jgi:hypothetical protein